MEDEGMRSSPGFTLIELMIVVVVLGILVAAGIVNSIAMRDRAHEASVKSNMHTFQLAAEDYATRYDGDYAADASDVAAVLAGMPAGSTFKNPYDQSTGSSNSWRDQGTWALPMVSGTTRAGCVAYGDSVSARYQIVGRAKAADLTLILRN
jgi:prepilin-type N-terminal cleavage/methylation domain-containing protein